MDKRRGTVTRVDENEAIVTFEDGSTEIVAISSMIVVEVGMTVTIVDVGESAPIYLWGDT